MSDYDRASKSGTLAETGVAGVRKPATLADVRHLGTIPVHHPTKPDAADVLGIGRRLAYALAASGELPTIRLGSRVLVPVPALLAMLGEHSVSTGNQDSQGSDLWGSGTPHTSTPAPLTPGVA